MNTMKRLSLVLAAALAACAPAASVAPPPPVPTYDVVVEADDVWVVIDG